MNDPLIFSTSTYKKVGLKHSFKDKPCEDSVARKSSSNGSIVAVAVSDGAGSRKHSLEGSSIIADYSTELIINHFDLLWSKTDCEIANFIISEVCKPLERAAEANGWDMEEMLATLICVAMHQDGRYLAFHVGDGVIVGYSLSTGSVVLSQYEHEYASHIVTFVNAPNPTYKVIRGRKDYYSFLLTSDGAEPYLIPGGIVSIQAMMMQQASFILSRKDMEDYMESLTQTLKSECHADDDISFAVISDNRYISDVFSEMNIDFLKGLMDIKYLPQKKKDDYASLIQLLHLYPNGIHWRTLCSQMYIHKKNRLLKKLQRMFPGEYVNYKNGRIYI